MDGTTQNSLDLAVRPGEIGDLEAVLALECAAFESDRLSHRALRRFLTAERRPLIVARASGRLIGYILVSLPGRSRVARVYSLAVEAGAGRRGVGGELLRAAERYARAHGRVAIRLEARYDNEGAIALYRKHGYQPFGHCPGYYADGAEALRFEKSLASQPPNGNGGEKF